jgi:hypothetical protein
MMAKRGQMTEYIALRSKELLGYEITVRELRLMPYIMYVLMNEQKLDPNKITAEEREIFIKWKKAGHLAGGMTGLSVTREFWDIMCSIVFLGYVAYREDATPVINRN